MFPFLGALLTCCAYAFLALIIASLMAYYLYPAIISDLDFLFRFGRIIVRKQKWLRNNISIIDVYEDQVEKRGDQTFLLYEDQQLSYSDVNKQANRLMNYLIENGEVVLRDVVCLLMYNKPCFVYSWLAINKCGATAALLNTQIRGKSLLYCIKISTSKIIFCGNDPELVEALVEIKPELDELSIKVFIVGAIDKPAVPKGFSNLTELSQDSSEENNLEARRGIDVNKDSCAYIYTSGTTGFPKATDMSHRRLATIANLGLLFEMDSEDVFYLCLPLYHTAAFGAGLSNVISTGGTGALRKKFSAKEFWNDVRRYKITIIQYIGETARYLVQAPCNNLDGAYPQGPIRLAIGNGLTADIWKEFRDRFNIGRICEYYGASEGNFVTFNTDGKEGTVGRYTALQEKLLGVLQVIECEWETAEPKRGPDGFCIPCPNGKAGLLCTKISKVLPYDGYVGEKAMSEKKLIRDVLKKGDCYFNTGDLMLIDVDGYVYFKDRLGDTFRWKGENVATCEVEQSLLENSQIESAIVYGVKIEGKDGRAGMATLNLKNKATLDSLAMYQHITERLPSYACPKFIRVKESIEVTGTFKKRKVNLVKEGFDPKKISDPLYYMNDKEKTYSVLDENVFDGIAAGIIRI